MENEVFHADNVVPEDIYIDWGFSDNAISGTVEGGMCADPLLKNYPFTSTLPFIKLLKAVCSQVHCEDTIMVCVCVCSQEVVHEIQEHPHHGT